MSSTSGAREFSLVKGAERFSIRCTPGAEEAAIGQLMSWAEDPDIDFDWFDAAVLSRQLNQGQLQRVRERQGDTDT